MANSKLLKEAIADAKAVRETAIANAKLALEEAFTPRLQSILSKRIQAEMEEMDDEEVVEEELDTTGIGTGDNVNPKGYEAHTELDPETEEETAAVGEEDENLEVVDTLTEEEEGYEDPTNADDATIGEEEEEMEFDEDEMDLEEIIRELEGEMDDEEELHTEEEEFEFDAEDEEEIHTEEEDEELDIEIEDDEVTEEEEMEAGDDEFSDEIDLDEILREMGYGDDDEEEMHEEEEVEAPVDNTAELEAELEEAYTAIKSLKKTINEVNLLNAKLLYANKLFRSYNLNNEQKMKVVENLDRTTSVREVKLVYATLAESMKFTGTERKVKASITEGFASKPTRSTAPKKEIISEANDMADRFKTLAGIIRK
jgi:hypothetical protein